MPRPGFWDLGLDSAFPAAFKIHSFSLYVPFDRIRFKSFLCPGLNSWLQASRPPGDLQATRPTGFRPGHQASMAWILLFRQPSKSIHFPFTFLLTELDLRAFCAQGWILSSRPPGLQATGRPLDLQATRPTGLPPGHQAPRARILLFRQPSKPIHFPYTFLLTELYLRAFCAQTWILGSRLGFCFPTAF